MNNKIIDGNRTGMGMSHTFIYESLQNENPLEISDPKREIIIVDPEKEYNELSDYHKKKGRK